MADFLPPSPVSGGRSGAAPTVTGEAQHPAATVERRWAIVGALLGGIVLALLAGLLGLVWLGRTGGLPSAAISPTPGASAAGAYIYPDPQPAPPLALVDQDGLPFDLTSLRGAPAIVFFGYTHCPDVCPTTIGTLNRVLGETGDLPRMVFVSVDPERDTPEALKSYLEFLPDRYTALTGSALQVRAAADSYGVNYARIETGSAGGYAMAHTANVYLIDADGLLRERFPFGTGSAPIAAAVRSYASPTAGASQAPSAAASPAASAPPSVSPAPSAGASATPAASDDDEALDVVVVSTAVWAGGASPVLMTLTDASGAPVGATTTDGSVQLVNELGISVGEPVAARTIRPTGSQRDVLVARLDIPTGGHWRVAVAVTDGGRALRGWADINVLDPGLTAPLGESAPDVRTPTAADVGGVLAAVTTDPQPDPRLTQTSTADARAAGRPYVLVVDSYRFRVSPACGRAIGIARFLADRWPDVAFIHLEPYAYTLVSGTPVLDGDISNPKLTAVARSWGLGEGQWGAATVPWVFVVDGNGTVQAKYTGVMGSDDIDVVLTDIAG